MLKKKGRAKLNKAAGAKLNKGDIVSYLIDSGHVVACDGDGIDNDMGCTYNGSDVSNVKCKKSCDGHGGCFMEVHSNRFTHERSHTHVRARSDIYAIKQHQSIYIHIHKYLAYNSTRTFHYSFVETYLS